MGKTVIKTVVQMVASIYASKMAHKYVGILFDRAVGKKEQR